MVHLSVESLVESNHRKSSCPMNSIVIATSPITSTHEILSLSCETVYVVLAPSMIFSSPYSLLFDALIDLGCCLLVGSKQTDDTGPFWVQDVPVLIPNHLVQLQDPVGRRQEIRCTKELTRENELVKKYQLQTVTILKCEHLILFSGFQHFHVKFKHF